MVEFWVKYISPLGNTSREKIDALDYDIDLIIYSIHQYGFWKTEGGGYFYSLEICR